MNREELTRLNSQLRGLRKEGEAPIHLYADSFRQQEEFSWLFIAHNLGKVTLGAIEVFLSDNGYKNFYDSSKTYLNLSAIQNANGTSDRRRLPIKYIYKDLHGPFEPMPDEIRPENLYLEDHYEHFKHKP